MADNRRHSSSMDLVVYDDEDSTSFYDASYTTNNINKINHSNHSGGGRRGDNHRIMDQIDEQTYNNEDQTTTTRTYTSNYDDDTYTRDQTTYQSYDERKSAVNTTTSIRSSSQYEYEEENYDE